MKNAKYMLNVVAAFVFSTFLTVEVKNHDKLLWFFALAALPLGIWLMRSDPPWWHSSSTLASLAAGRLCTNAWLNARNLRSGPILDDFVWFFVMIALFLFLTELAKLRRPHSRT